MKGIQYKKFSWNTRRKNWNFKRPNACQFELTFRCGLHCKHCYSGCYNKPAYIKKELDTRQVKFILDKTLRAGTRCLCFTGGDPLTRPDFLEIYSYAKEKSFIIAIFTNGYSMTKRAADYLKKNPPFAIEITLNAVTRKTYEDISQINGSYDKTMDGFKMITQRKLPLKIKTQVMQDNLEELPKIKKFVKNLGLKLHPSVDLNPRLNRDLTPCNLRISPQEVLCLNGKKQSSQTPNANLFHCAPGGKDGIKLDPYGNMFLCHLIRQPSFNLLKVDIQDALSRLSPLARERKFTTGSKCKYCKIRDSCNWCPGRALLETGDMESPIDYYCELAHLVTEKSLIRG